MFFSNFFFQNETKVLFRICWNGKYEIPDLPNILVTVYHVINTYLNILKLIEYKNLELNL